MNIPLTKFRTRVQKAEVELSHAKETNAKLQDWKASFHEYRQVYAGLEELSTDYKSLRKFISVVRNKYMTTALAILEQDIKNSLDLVFPDEDFNVKIEPNDNNGDPTAILYIGKKDLTGNSDNAEDGIDWQLPVLQNGGLVKQLISFSAISSILGMLGVRELFLDEAFNSGDSKSLAELSPYFMKLFSDGFQILCIEHKQEVYTSLPHRAFYYKKDRTLDKIYLDYFEDKGQLDFSKMSELLKNGSLNSQAALDQLKGFTEDLISEKYTAMGIDQAAIELPNATMPEFTVGVKEITPAEIAEVESEFSSGLDWALGEQTEVPSEAQSSSTKPAQESAPVEAHVELPAKVEDSTPVVDEFPSDDDFALLM